MAFPLQPYDARNIQIVNYILLRCKLEQMHSVHGLPTRKMGGMVVVDAHLEVDASMTVEAGHDIAVLARQRVVQRHRVLNLMTHVNPWRCPDLDHEAYPIAVPLVVR